MLKRNRINQVFSAKPWLLDGWGIYKRAPITWTFMILLFSIAYIVAMNSLPGKAIAALLVPVFLGGIYVAAFKADNGEPISMEALFSMFKDSQKLKQLLTIGGIGVAVVASTYLVENMAGSDYAMATGRRNSINYRETTLGETLSQLVFWAWSLATLFSIPLVAITNQGAIESIKNSIFAALFNLIPLFLFSFCAILLTILSAIPFGLGLFVVVPILFCATYFIFKTVYLEGNDKAQATAGAGASAPHPDGFVDALTTEPESALNSAQGLVQSSAKGFAESLAETMEQAQNNYDPRDKTDDSMPQGFSLNYFDDYMQITRKWVGFSTISLFIGAAIFNGVWIANGFAEIIVSDRELLLKLFCAVFIALGAGTLYFAIASALNKTEVYVNKNAIAIQHHPVPWLGNKTIETKNIKQIYVKTTVKRNDGRTYSKHQVTGLTSDNHKIKLISGLTNFHQASFIEKKIEDYLDIEDEVVADERR